MTRAKGRKQPKLMVELLGKERIAKLHSLPGYAELLATFPMASGKQTKRAIKENKLDTKKKYEAYRKANPSLNLPTHEEVEELWVVSGWGWKAVRS